MNSSVAGTLGNVATALVARRCGGMTVVRGTAEGRVFAGSGARVVSNGQSICAIIGSPRLNFADTGRQPADPDDIEPWKTVLLGPATGVNDRIGGHFALIYVDLVASKVVLATDRFGSYSLYYRQTDDGLAFADCADVLFDENPSLSVQALYDYLYFHCIPAGGTVHHGVQRLEPGQLVRWEQGRLTEVLYWGRNADGPLYADYDEAKEDFYRLLRESVADELDTGTTGAFLSGGTDSSTIVGLLAERSAVPVKSYSIGFDVDGYDEAGYAKLAAEHFGSDHRTYYVTPDDLVARIPSVAANLDQPFGNSSLLPAIICAERARDDGITTLLAGDGGDELFGGNTRYAKQKMFGWYEAIPTVLRKALIEPMTRPNLATRIPLFSKVKSYVDQARVPLPDRFETYNTLEREGVAALLPDAWLTRVDTTHPRNVQRQVWAALAADNLIDRILEFEWKFTLADNDLRKVRYAAEIVGIQVGFPLLSDDLVDFSLRLKPDWKVKGLELRWFFKRALADFLPPEIIRKKKHGFGLPFGTWALQHGELRRMTSSSIQSLVERGLVRRSYANMLMKERLPAYPSYYGEQVWILMMLELWLQAHSPNWRVDL